MRGSSLRPYSCANLMHAAHPKGKSMFGVSDMVGNIWQVMARNSPHANCLLECRSRTLNPQP